VASLNALLLLTSRSTSRHQTVYGGICLEQRPLPDLDPGPVDAWLLGAPAQRVAVARHRVSFSHMSTSRGSMWQQDGRILTDVHPLDRLALLAGNNFIHLKFAPPREVALPAFVGPDPALVPRRDDVVVRMIARRLLDLPDARVIIEQMERQFGRHNAAVRADREALGSTPPFAGLALPVEFGGGGGASPTRAVLHLGEARGADAFAAPLYRAGGGAALPAGVVLRREAWRDSSDRAFRHEADVAVVTGVLGSGPLEPQSIADGGVLRRDPDGATYPIVCFACGARLDPGRFTPEELAAVDVWGWLQPLLRERSLLTRARAMYGRHPEARGRVMTKPAAIVRDAAKTPESLNEPFDAQPDPRPPDYHRQLATWTEGDAELHDFLEHTHCDVNGRLQWVEAAIAERERELGGRQVVCPACGAGRVGMLTEA
jgi:hypothetical protein